MRLEILGSGGAVTTPKPFCRCPTCVAAREGGPQSARLGPSVFLHGPNLLIDTPEEIWVQLNRSKVTEIRACLYSHWHPDHTSGKRIFEMNKDWVGLPPVNRCTQVILPRRVHETFGQYLGILGHFEFLESCGLVDLVVVENQGAHPVDEYTVRPVVLAQDYSFGYDVAGQGKRVLIIMDELKSWDPSPEVRNTGYDLVYLPFGILDVNPLTGERTIDPHHPILTDEQTIDETLEVIRSLQARRFVLSHIEEPDGITLEMGARLGQHYSQLLGRSIVVAADTEVYEV